jgi:hypothetical protein
MVLSEAIEPMCLYNALCIRSFFRTVYKKVGLSLSTKKVWEKTWKAERLENV